MEVDDCQFWRAREEGEWPAAGRVSDHSPLADFKISLSRWPPKSSGNVLVFNYDIFRLMIYLCIYKTKTKWQQLSHILHGTIVYSPTFTYIYLFTSTIHGSVNMRPRPMDPMGKKASRIVPWFFRAPRLVKSNTSRHCQGIQCSTTF